MKKLLMLFLTFSCFGSSAFSKPPLAHQVNGHWVPVDPSNPLTQHKSENALELLESINQASEMPTEVSHVDIGQWSNAPHNVYQMADDLMKRDAAKIPFKVADFSLWGASVPSHVGSALDQLAEKIGKGLSSENVRYSPIDAEWGTDHPLNEKQAIDLLANKFVSGISSTTVSYRPTDVEAWGLNHPRTDADALDILIQELQNSRQRISALEAYVVAHP